MPNDSETLWTTLEDWSSFDIDRLLEALERDRSFDVSQLATYLGKSRYQVQTLLTVLFSCSEKDITGSLGGVMDMVTKPEGSLDILLQSTRFLSSSEFNVSRATAEVLDQFAAWLEKEENNGEAWTYLYRSIGFRLSQVYYYLSATLSCQPLPSLSGHGAVVILDLLTCLVHVMNSIRRPEEPPIVSGTSSSCGTNNTAPNTSPKDNPNPFVDGSVVESVTDKMGAYLAASASLHLFSRHHQGITGWDEQILQTKPVGPLFLLDGVKRTGTLRACTTIRNALFENLNEIWDFQKRLSTNCVSAKVSTNHPDFKQLIKKVNSFVLNPFGLSMPIVNAYLKIIRDVCELRSTSEASIETLLTNLMPKCPDLRVLSSDWPPVVVRTKKRPMKDESPQNLDQVKSHVEVHQQIGEPIVEVQQQPGKTSVEVHQQPNEPQSKQRKLSKSRLEPKKTVKINQQPKKSYAEPPRIIPRTEWMPSMYFKRVPDEVEGPDIRIKDYYLVRTEPKIQRPPPK